MFYLPSKKSNNLFVKISEVIRFDDASLAKVLEENNYTENYKKNHY